MPTTAIRTDASLMIMAGKKSLVYQFSFYGVRYCLTSDSNGCVSFIYVDDPGYILHDGFGIGDPAEKVLTLTGHTAIREDHPPFGLGVPFLSNVNLAGHLAGLVPGLLLGAITDMRRNVARAP